MPQNYPNESTGIHLVTSLGEEELTEEERVQLLQMLRIKNIPYSHGVANKEK